MKKLAFALLAFLFIAMPSCSQPSKTTAAVNTNAAINMQQMANDIATLKTNFTILNTSFTAIQGQLSNQPNGGASKADLDALAASLNTLKAKVDAIVIPTYTTTPPITDYVKKSELDAANAQITSLNAQISTLTASLTALTARVTALEHPPTTTAPPTTTTTAVKPIVTLTPFGGVASLTIVNPATTEQGLLYTLSVQNPSSITQNVAFTLYFIASPNFPAITDWASGYPKLTTMTGGTLYFALMQNQPNLIAFQSGVTIAPNTTNTYILNLAVKFVAPGIAAPLNIFTQVQ